MDSTTNKDIDQEKVIRRGVAPTANAVLLKDDETETPDGYHKAKNIIGPMMALQLPLYPSGCWISMRRLREMRRLVDEKQPDERNDNSRSIIVLTTEEQNHGNADERKWYRRRLGMPRNNRSHDNLLWTTGNKAQARPLV